MEEQIRNHFNYSYFVAPLSTTIFMTMLPQSMKRSRHICSIDDIPVEVLLMIFKRCEPLACFRARLVCRRWRTVIDKMDKESREAILGEGQARLYICDRRRYVSVFVFYGFCRLSRRPSVRY
uniref:F-box domain-containing protein n=1 Tax=Wuchereria bancrofti TaxID=6293 RepID=A0A1I8EWN7_WUCBA